MKYSVRAILLLLIVGAIINILVAWGCSYWSIPRYVEVNVIPYSQIAWLESDANVDNVYAADHWTDVGYQESMVFLYPSTPMINDERGYAHDLADSLAYLYEHTVLQGRRSFEEESYLWMIRNNYVPTRSSSNYSKSVIVHVRSGWPLLSLNGALIRDLGKDSASYAFHRARKIEGRGMTKVIPLRPMILPFAGNSIFYALLIGIFMILRLLTLKFMRLQKGLCPQCKYDLRGNIDPGCPECGWGRLQSSTSDN